MFFDCRLIERRLAFFSSSSFFSTSTSPSFPYHHLKNHLSQVSLPVVRQFVSRVEAAALGVGVTRGVTPDQQLVKVVYDQLKELMGGERSDLAVPESGPQVILLAGLQGVGKTTAAGKLALLLREQGKKVLLVAADVYRPAAVDQLTTLGKRLNVDVLAPEKKAAAGSSGSSYSLDDDDDDDDVEDQSAPSTASAPPRSRGEGSSARSPESTTPSSSTRRAGCRSTRR